MEIKDKLIYLSNTIGINYTTLSESTGIDRTTINRFVLGKRGLTPENRKTLELYINGIIKELKGE